MLGLSHITLRPTAEVTYPTYLLRFLANCFVSYATQDFPDTASIQAWAVRSLASKSTLRFVRARFEPGQIKQERERERERERHRVGLESVEKHEEPLDYLSASKT